MMPLLFSYRTHPIHEIERFLKIRKRERPVQMMLPHNLPIRQLALQRAQRIAFQRRNTTLARNASLIG